MLCCLFYNKGFNKHKEVYTNLFYLSRLLYTISRTTTTTTIRNNNNDDNNKDDDDDDDDEREKRKTIYIYRYVYFWNKMFMPLMMRQQ